MGDNRYYAGGSVVLVERNKGPCIVKIYVDGQKLLEKRTRDKDPGVQWESNPPMWASCLIFWGTLPQHLEPGRILKNGSHLAIKLTTRKYHLTSEVRAEASLQCRSMIVNGWFHLVLGSLKVSIFCGQDLCRSQILLCRAQAKWRSNSHHQCHCTSTC